MTRDQFPDPRDLQDPWDLILFEQERLKSGEWQLKTQNSKLNT
jgi:hypothetical protein